MTEQTSFEKRVADTIAEWADRAPIDVDAVSMTRIASSSGPRPAERSAWRWPTVRGLAFVLLLLALVVSIVSAAVMVGTSFFRPAPEDLLRRGALVEPFVGLPPEGAATSDPTTGDLVLGLRGRPDRALGDYYRLWLYADGRLIWKRNADTVASLKGRNWNGLEPTLALVEQRLTPDGAQLLRTRVAAKTTQLLAGAAEDEPRSRPGLPSGEIRLLVGNVLVSADWSAEDVPEMLVDPARFLAVDAWADQAVRGFVPSAYAICLEANEPSGLNRAVFLGRLPSSIREFFAPDQPRSSPQGAPEFGDCRTVGLEAARSIAAALESGGAVDAGRFTPDYRISDGGIGPVYVGFLAVVPHGEVVGDTRSP